MEDTQYLDEIQLLRLTANENLEKMAEFEVQTIFGVQSPNDWKSRVETTVKFKVKTNIEVYSLKGWKFKVKTTERKLKKNFEW